METVEIVVYLAVAVITGMMLLTVLKEWDTKETYDNLKGMILNEKEVGYKQLEKEDFIAEIFNFWEQCGLGAMNQTERIYVTSGVNISKEEIIDASIKLNLCDTLSSSAYGCGIREDLNMSQNITLPAVVKLHCNPTNHHLEIK